MIAPSIPAVLTKYPVLHTLLMPQYTFPGKLELLLHLAVRVHLDPVHHLTYRILRRDHHVQVHEVSIDADLDKLDVRAVLS